MTDKVSRDRRSVMRPAMVWTALRYVLSGKLRVRDGHLAPSGHLVPVDFAGVGVAAAEAADCNAWKVDTIEALGIRNVRLDITYGDLNGVAAGLLETLIAHDIKVLLHLVQPVEAARRMTQADAQAAWHDFLEAVLDRFGAGVSAVEIGSTINRRRWAGYDAEGFFAAWNIAHEQVRRRGLVLAGPNVTDFEPLYNIGILDRLARAGQLPDIHTNNLFSERVIEPERFDSRILRYAWTTVLKMNLIKKARLLRKITSDFGVAEFVSPSAFWTLPRILRFLPDTEQKQADYLARYFVLCAASGAMRHAFWGPLVCAREGLVDDASGSYPELERVTHYSGSSGNPADYRRRPAFDALQAFQRFIPGSRYEGTLHTGGGLEVHAFRAAGRYFHVAWTINAHAVPLRRLYAAEHLQAAVAFSRDGDALTVLPDFVTESPMYLTWPEDARVAIHASSEQDYILLHRHHPGKQAYLFEADGWRGAVLASSPEQAKEMRRAIHPARLPPPSRETLMRKARNAIWRAALPDGTVIVAKKPLKMHLHKRLLDRFRPSKARRSWDAAAQLLRRGIPTAAPVAFIEADGAGRLLENYYLCEFVDTQTTVREMMTAFAQGAASFMGVPEQEAYRQLCEFLLRMHGRGVYFRDLSGGNILLRNGPEGVFEFTLIDINRARFFNHKPGIKWRISDLTRVCQKLHWAGREALVGQYLEALGKKFTWRLRLRFHLYDAKVWLKRRFGRKGFKRLFSAASGS